MKMLLSVLALSVLPLTAYASPAHPLAATKPTVEHNLEVQQRHAKRLHETDHAHSPARDKSFHQVDGRVTTQPHMRDARRDLTGSNRERKAARTRAKSGPDMFLRIRRMHVCRR